MPANYTTTDMNLRLEWREHKGEFTYNVSANLSTYYSELTDWVFPEGVTREEEVRRDNFAIEVGIPLHVSLYLKDRMVCGPMMNND